MASLLELVQDTLTPDIIGKITNLVGETPAATESALRRAAPAVLAGVADNASTAEGAEHMRPLVRDGGWGADLLNNLGSRLGGGDATSGLVAAGTNLLASLFGRNADGVVDVISRDVRVRPGSASTILSLAAPIVMSVLGKQMASRGLSASGLAEMLGAERGSLLAALPAGLSGLLGLRGAAAETIPRERQRTVNALLAVLKAYPSAQMALEGHTDGSGDAAANKTLSEQRAAAVKQTLVDGGVAANRIRAEGYGQERPIADNTSDAGRARNRRLELVVTQR